MVKKVLFFVFFINVLYFSCYTSQGVFVLCGQVTKDLKTKTFSWVVILISVAVKGRTDPGVCSLCYSNQRVCL